MPRRNPPVPLHDVSDVEAFVKTIVSKRARKIGDALAGDKFDEAVAQLLADSVELSQRYRPGAASFSTYLGERLPNRLTDHLRREEGDTRYANRAELVPLDETTLEESADPYDFVEQITEAAAIADDLSRLPAWARQTIEEIVLPLSRGASYEDLARELGSSRRKIGRRVEDVRNALFAIAYELDLEVEPLAPTTDEIVEGFHALTEED